MEIFYYFLILGALFSVFLNQKHLPSFSRYFILLLLLSLVVEAVRYVLPDTNPLSRFLFSIYTPAEYLLLSLVLISCIHSSLTKKVIKITIPIFILISLFIQFGLESANSFYRFLDVVLEAPLLITWTLLYFFQIFRNEEEIMRNPMFWISVGNLLFFAGSFFSYGFGSYLRNIGQQNLATTTFLMAKILNITLYIFYIIGFLCSRTTRYSS